MKDGRGCCLKRAILWFAEWRKQRCWPDLSVAIPAADGIHGPLRGYMSVLAGRGNEKGWLVLAVLSIGAAVINYLVGVEGAAFLCLILAIVFLSSWNRERKEQGAAGKGGE